jgi:hypothetical protein
LRHRGGAHRLYDEMFGKTKQPLKKRQQGFDKYLQGPIIEDEKEIHAPAQNHGGKTKNDDRKRPSLGILSDGPESAIGVLNCRMHHIQKNRSRITFTPSVGRLETEYDMFRSGRNEKPPKRMIGGKYAGGLAVYFSGPEW